MVQSSRPTQPATPTALELLTIVAAYSQSNETTSEVPDFSSFRTVAVTDSAAMKNFIFERLSIIRSLNKTLAAQSRADRSRRYWRKSNIMSGLPGLMPAAMHAKIWQEQIPAMLALNRIVLFGWTLCNVKSSFLYPQKSSGAFRKKTSQNNMTIMLIGSVFCSTSNDRRR